MAFLPEDRELTIGFAHAAYQLQAEYERRAGKGRCITVKSVDELKARIGEFDVLLVSMLWRNALIAAAPRLRFIQSVSAGLSY